MPETTPDTRDRLLLSLRRLSDDELVARVKGLAARERRATALLVAHLAELETRDVYLRAGYSSLFTYCREVLALSEHEAYNRIEAARTARRFPVILDFLAAGEVTLTTVRLLGPHLTRENHRSVLESARGKHKAEVEEIVATLSPRPEVPASIRQLPERKPASLLVATLEPPARIAPMARAAAVLPASAEAGPPALPAGTPEAAAGTLAAAAGPLASAAGPLAAAILVPLPHPRRSAEVTPLSPDRYRYQLTIGGSTLEKLRLAKDMLRHALPSGDDEAILDRALTALLTDLARKEFGAGEKPRSSEKAGLGSGRVGSPGSRHVPAPVKRAVWVRDLGRCTFAGTDGRRCGERGFLEFHHVRPYAAGGEASIENIQLRCRRHNGYESRVFFAREPVGEGRRPGGTGGPALMSGTSDGSSPVRSGTTRRDRDVVSEGARSGKAQVVPSLSSPAEPAVRRVTPQMA